MARYSYVLFVVAAGNGADEVVASPYSRYPPAGMDLPNVVTVGGTAHCRPDLAASESNFGPGVDMAAPSEQVPTVSINGGLVRRDGTSLAVAQVTSLAAILKSLNRGMTPNQIKQHMHRSDVGRLVPVSVGGTGLMFTHAIVQLLMDMGVGDPVREWLDPNQDGEAEDTWGVIRSICPAWMEYDVEGYGTHLVEPGTSDYRYLAGAFDPPGINFSGMTTDADLSIGGDGTFCLDYQYVVVLEASGPNTMEVTYHDVGSGAPDGTEIGHGTDGVVAFTSCRIDERDPFTGSEPLVVAVSGYFEGTLRVLHYGDPDFSYYGFEGEFQDVPFVVGRPIVDEDLILYLEWNCEGGIPAMVTDGE